MTTRLGLTRLVVFGTSVSPARSTSVELNLAPLNYLRRPLILNLKP